MSRVNQYKKVVIVFSTFICLFLGFKAYQYLALPQKTISVIEEESTHGTHQYLTLSDVKEKQLLNKEFSKKMHEAGIDLDKQKIATDNYIEKLQLFNKKIFFKNESEFKLYSEQLTAYFSLHPELKKGEIFDEYIYFNSNVEQKLFNQAAQNLIQISDKVGVKFLEE